MSFESVRIEQGQLFLDPRQPPAEQGYRLIHLYRGVDNSYYKYPHSLKLALDNIISTLHLNLRDAHLNSKTITAMVTDISVAQDGFQHQNRARIEDVAQRAAILACLLEQLEPNAKYTAEDGLHRGERMKDFIKKAFERQLPTFEEEQTELEEYAYRASPVGQFEQRQTQIIQEYSQKIFSLEKGARERDWKLFLTAPDKYGKIKEPNVNNDKFLSGCQLELEKTRKHSPNFGDYIDKLSGLCTQLQDGTELTPELITKSRVFVQIWKGQEQPRKASNMGLDGMPGLFAEALFRFGNVESSKQELKAEFERVAQEHQQLKGRNVIEWPKDFDEVQAAPVVAEAVEHKEAAEPQAEEPAKKESYSLFGRVGNAIGAFLSSCKEKLINLWRWLWG